MPECVCADLIPSGPFFLDKLSVITPQFIGNSKSLLCLVFLYTYRNCPQIVSLNCVVGLLSVVYWTIVVLFNQVYIRDLCILYKYCEQ